LRILRAIVLPVYDRLKFHAALMIARGGTATSGRQAWICELMFQQKEIFGIRI
jgi:hypothetical protein